MRQALRKGPPQAETARPITFMAPRRGWLTNENLVTNRRDAAAQLDNTFPTANGARVRRGSMKRATIGAGGAVGAIMPYNSAASGKLFAANSSAIYDITSPASPSVSPAAAQSGLSGGDWSFVQTTNTGGTYLTCVNGADIRQFNGSAWSTPVFTGGSGPYVAIFAAKKRLWLLKAGSLDVYYSDVDAIAGALSLFPLGGIFKLGGTLLFGTTWSVNTGNGLVENVIFVTTEGEVAVYAGTNPGDAAAWSIQGVYRIGRPLGKRAFFQAGGDVGIATDIGLVPVSQAISMDPAALAAKAISYGIEPDWNKEVGRRRSQYSWSVEMWPTEQMAIVSMPAYASLDKICFVVNVRTGAWARYTGWSTQCLGLFQDRMFFGTIDGLIMEAEVGGDDNGLPYTAVWVPRFDNGDAPGRLKNAKMARALLRTSSKTGVQLSFQRDSNIDLPAAPAASPTAIGDNTWGTAVWGTSVWGADDSTLTTEGIWQSTPGVGYQVSVAAQITIGSTLEPVMEWMQLDLELDQGAMVAVG